MKFSLVVFGCQMNENDADRLRTILNALGATEEGDAEKADLVIIVTCSIRQHAEDRVYGLLKKLKKTGRILALTGCMVQKTSLKKYETEEEAKNRDPLLKRVIPLDFVFRIKEAQKLPDLLRRFFPISDEFSGEFAGIFQTLPTQKQKYSAFVPISTGCDHFCTYCIVPHTRGREECRPQEEILEECHQLVAAGAKEITLLGQNVNRYYRGIRGKNPHQTDFAQLLEEVAQIPELIWLRFLSPHPQHLGDDVLEVMAQNSNICDHLHLPIQSGDDKILRKMARGYTAKQFQEITKKARKMMPDIAITTDVIVGFCGETKEQFENSKQICDEENFDMNFIAKFSVRKNTPAQKWDDDVSLEEKKRRFHALNEILKKTSLANKKAQMGKTELVLIDSVDEKDIAKGHTEHGRGIFFPIGKRGSEATGEMVSVCVTGAKEFYLEGKMV